VGRPAAGRIEAVTRGAGAALVALALTGPSCASLRHLDAGIEQVRAIVQANDCHDGAPARILVDPHCVQGICGVTCAPDRWR
jgi:hypothetical protein